MADDEAVVLIDGNRQTDFGVPSFTVVHGDAISQSIAAASILAKVTRDRQMEEIAKEYSKAYGHDIVLINKFHPCRHYHCKACTVCNLVKFTAECVLKLMHCKSVFSAAAC